MKIDRLILHGRYYGRTPGGRLVEIAVAAGAVPDVQVCRRVADFPRGVPTGATVDGCTRCGAPVARQPIKHAPIVCMQCAGIEPLPIEES